MRLNTFDEVASWYNKTAPIRGARKAWDLRPLWDRKRWWERIIKIDDNTYALSDGNSAYSTRGKEATEEKLAEVNREALLVAPIVWMRRKDGDYVRVRGSVNHGWSTSRYKFLEMYLPNGLSHCANNNGVHWIQAANQRYLLPIFKHKWGTGTNEEDKYLEFKLDGGKFLLTSERYQKTVPVVNRDLTKHYNPKIREMWAMMQILMPVLGSGMREVANTQSIEHGIPTWNHEWRENRYSDVVRNCLDDPEGNAEKRYALMVVTSILSNNVEDKYHWDRNGGSYESRFKDEGKKSYNRFKKLMHKIGDMTTTKQVDFE
jgi:hypothetical protein